MSRKSKTDYTPTPPEISTQESQAIEAGDVGALNEAMDPYVGAITEAPDMPAEEPSEAVTDDPVNDPPFAEESAQPQMLEYVCVAREGRYAAIIVADGRPIAAKEAPSKYEAMLLRDEAKRKGASDFGPVMPGDEILI